MVISGSHHVPGVNNIMGGMEHTNGVRMHNHRRKLRQRYLIFLCFYFYFAVLCSFSRIVWCSGDYIIIIVVPTAIWFQRSFLGISHRFSGILLDLEHLIGDFSWIFPGFFLDFSKIS